MTLLDLLGYLDADPDVLSGQQVQALLDKMRAAGVPVDTWTSAVNTNLALSQAVGDTTADLKQLVAQYLGAALFQYARGEGVTLAARGFFQLDRYPAAPTVGKFRLAASAGFATRTFVAGELTAGALGASGQLYSNIDGGTLNASGALSLTFEALQPGTGGNIPVNSQLALRTVIPGVSITNPVYASGTWITSPGLAEESDQLLIARCLSRWSTLGAGGNAEAMYYWATKKPAGYAASPVTQVRIYSNRLGGAIVGNGVTVLVAGPAGALLPGDLAAVAANFETPKKYPLNTILLVATTTNRTIPIVGNVNVLRDANLSQADALGLLATGFATYQANFPIGGYSPGNLLYRQALEGRGEQALPDGSVRDVAITSPATPTVALAYDTTVVFDLSGLTVTLVA